MSRDCSASELVLCMHLEEPAYLISRLYDGYRIDCAARGAQPKSSQALSRADLRKKLTKTRLIAPLMRLPCFVNGASIEDDRVGVAVSACRTAKYGERDMAERSWVMLAKYIATPGTFLDIEISHELPGVKVGDAPG
jgi:hypothetical protein